jgi:hypothetical protein
MGDGEMPRERVYGDDQSQLDVLIDWAKQTGEPPTSGREGAVFLTVARKTDEASTDARAAVRLDRRGINRAIAALRRARDQAYGRDE